MQYSPKLKIAMEEIKAILHKHDIAGFVTLHTPGHTEFLMELQPSYSCCRVQGDQIRVRAKLIEDFAGNKEIWHRKVNDTSDMLHGICDTSGRIIIQIMNLSDILDKKVDADHNDRGFTSHSTQNN